MFVPMGNTCEINKLTLTNHGSEHKEISVFSYVEFCLWTVSYTHLDVYKRQV